MSESLALPASVASRSCFTQLLGEHAIEPGAADALLTLAQQVGVEKVWAANRLRGEYPEFSPAVFALADMLAKLDIPTTIPDGFAAMPDADEGGPHSQPPPYVNAGGIAVIPVSGPLSKHPHSFSHEFGGSSTVGMRKALAMANRDDKVQSILFHIDSPGGTVAGTGDLGDDIFASAKPTASYIEDLGASAAYWLASQTDSVFASEHAQVGSIGTLMVVHDTSEMASKQGIKVHVLKSAPLKGGPIPGAPVAKEQLSALQGRIDAMNDRFVSAIARGRGMEHSPIKSLATGELFDAAAAKKHGLVDELMNLREAMSSWKSRGAKRVKGGHSTAMSIDGALRVPGSRFEGKGITYTNTNGFITTVVVDDSQSTPPSNMKEGSVPPGSDSRMPDVNDTKDDGTSSAKDLATEVASLRAKMEAMEMREAEEAKKLLATEKNRLLAEYSGILEPADVEAMTSLSQVQAQEKLARKLVSFTPSPKAGSRAEPPSEVAAHLKELDASRTQWLQSISLTRGAA